MSENYENEEIGKMPVGDIFTEYTKNYVAPFIDMGNTRWKNTMLNWTLEEAYIVLNDNSIPRDWGPKLYLIQVADVFYEHGRGPLNFPVGGKWNPGV